VNQEILKIVQKAIQNELYNKIFPMSEELAKQKLILKTNKNGVIIENFVQALEDAYLAFVPVEDKNFYVTYQFEKNNLETICHVDHYPGVFISYTATSEIMSVDELCAMTKLKPNRIQYIGDTMNSKRNILYNYNSITFETNDNKPNLFHIKIRELLDYLNTDAENIRKLAKITECDNIWIDVCFNSMYSLTAVGLDTTDIQLFNNIGLCPTFDIYGQL
jgi:hypothetical protein